MKPRTSRSRRPLHLPLRPLAFSIACIGIAPALAQTILPSYGVGGYTTVGGVAVGSSTTPTALGGQALGISQSSLRAIINWNAFSIGKNDAVHINQQMGSASILLNRVTGNDPSTIAGQLSANGRVFLINPNGVLFGAGASGNVGGHVASTPPRATSAIRRASPLVRSR